MARKINALSGLRVPSARPLRKHFFEECRKNGHSRGKSQEDSVMRPRAVPVRMIGRTGIAIVIFFAMVALLAATPALSADDSKVKSATEKVETGAKKIGQGEVGQGVKDTAKGIGETASEGAKYTGEKLKESGEAAKAPAKSAWENVKDGARDFGRSVKNFFSKLFS